MDDLFALLIGAMIAAVAVTLAIMAACCVLAATLAATSAFALAVGVGVFAGSFGSSIWSRGGARRAPKDPEPAFELYVLGQLLADFRHALSQAGTALTGVRGKLAAGAEEWSRDSAVMLPVTIGLVLGGYLGTATAIVAGGLIGVLVGLAVAIASAISWLLILALRLADGVRRRIRRASYECPVDHERFPLPLYVCPSCGATHTRLVPGRWGIFKRECECGNTALPTTVINGRQRVPQRCPSGHPMSGFLGFAENVPIAIAGGVSAGKSAFLAGALMELEDPASGLALEPLEESRDAYSRLVDDMRCGVAPVKTVEERPPALVAEIQGSGSSRALYAYDVAGEVYGAEDKVRGLRFLARSAGIAILIDPFSIPQVASDHAQELATLSQQILPSSEDPMRVVERLLSTLGESGARAGEIPLAVVVAKSDACGIDRQIQQLAAACGTERAPREWLVNNGAGNLVRTVEHEFKRVGWFSVSALGRMPTPSDKSAFVPRGALAPLLWILERHNIRTARAGAAPSHTAKRLVSDAADFPLPSPALRVAQVLGSVALVLALAAVLVAIAAGGGGSTANAVSTDSTGPSGTVGLSHPSPPLARHPAHAARSAGSRRPHHSAATPRHRSRGRGAPHRATGRARASERRSSSPSSSPRSSEQSQRPEAPRTSAPSASDTAPSGGTSREAPATGGLQGQAGPAGKPAPTGHGGLHGSVQSEGGSGHSGGGGLSGSASNG